MAAIDQILAQSRSAPSDAGLGGLAEGFSQGASLAAHIQAVQQQRYELEQKKQQQYIAKVNYITSKMRDGLLLPKVAQDPYFRNLQAQAEHLQIPYDKSAEAIVRDPENRTAALAGLNHMIGLPDDEKAQKGQQFFAMMGGDVNSLTQLMLHVKEAQSKAALASANMGVRQQSLTNRMDTTGTNKVDNDKELVGYTQRLNGVARMQDILDAAKRGDIQTNGQIKNLIGEEVARLEIGGNTGLGMSERNTPLRTGQDLKADIEERLTGSPDDAIAPGQLNQLNGLLRVMKASYMQQYDSRVSTLSQDPRPEVQNIVQNKADEFRRQNAQRFGSWDGQVHVDSPDAGKRRFVDALTPDMRNKFSAKYGPNWDTSDGFDRDFRAYKAQQTGSAQPKITPASGTIPSGQGGSVAAPVVKGTLPGSAPQAPLEVEPISGSGDDEGAQPPASEEGQ